MISFCIPAYNYDLRPLVYQINELAVKEKINFEIIIVEDGSDKEFIDINTEINQTQNVKHIVHKENQGRSAARNFLAETAKYDNIVFLDCDSKIPDNYFISNYIKAQNEAVVCGGTIYLPEQKIKNSELRYYYGIKREMIQAKDRNIKPNRAFATNNFMIKKEIFKSIRFREFLKKYGHEDSLFGFELQQNGIKILHIDNPVIHAGIEDNRVFLAKTEEGIKNLKLIENNKDIDVNFLSEIKLLRTYQNLEKMYLSKLVRISFKIMGKIIKSHLINSRKPCIRVFDYFKIGYYCEIKE